MLGVVGQQCCVRLHGSFDSLPNYNLRKYSIQIPHKYYIRRFCIKIDPLACYDFSVNCDFSNFFFNFWRNCRNRSFCSTPLYVLYHLNLVILAKTAISPIFRNFCNCVQTWTYLSVTNILGIRSLVTGS